MLVKHFIGIFKKYKGYQKSLKDLKEHAHKEDEYLSAEEWAKLYAQEYGKYVRWMNSPLGDVLQDL